MGLFGKKKQQKEEAPSLPELPNSDEELLLNSRKELPEIPQGLPEIETYELPQLPEMAIQNKFTQNQAIEDFPEQKSFKQLKPGLPRVIEIDSSKEKQFIKSPLVRTESGFNNEFIRSPIRREINPSQDFVKPSIKKIEPIYIRLDKFETTIESFREIKNKIIQIEELLQETKKIKQKEEQELAEWEREIQMIKVRIDSIDKNIFSQLD